MKIIALILLTGITTNPTSLITATDGDETLVRKSSHKDSTSLSPPYRLHHTSAGQAVDVNALFWTRQVNDVLRSKLIKPQQPIADLVCFFRVLQNGTIIGPVTFSRTLEPDQAKHIKEEIMHLSPFPSLAGHGPRKVYFEIAKDGDTCVGFAK
jgi:hypothetical protein